MSQRLHTSTRVENISLDPWTRDHRPLWLQAWSGHKHDCSGRIVGFNSADGLNIDRFYADGTIAVQCPVPVHTNAHSFPAFQPATCTSGVFFFSFLDWSPSSLNRHWESLKVSIIILLPLTYDSSRSE